MATNSGGYSGTPLPKKLGIREGSRVAVVAAPQGFDAVLGALPPGAELRTHARGRLDVIVFFVTRRAELARRFPSFARALDDDGGLWVAWPKKTSGVATDLGVRRGAAHRARRRAGRQQGGRHRRHLVRVAVRVPRRGPGASLRFATTGGVCADGSCRCRRPSCSSTASAWRRPRSTPREPDYNVTPRAMVPIVRDRPPRKGDDGPTKRALTMVRWGLVPSWAESTAIGDKLINAAGGDHHREGRVQARVPSPPLHRAGRRVLRVAPVEADVDQAAAAPAVPDPPSRR